MELGTDGKTDTGPEPWNPQSIVQELLASFIKAIIQEGKRFAETSEGQVYLQTLPSSSLVKNARILWMLAGMETIISGDVQPAPLSLLLPVLGDDKPRVSLEKFLTGLFQVDVNE
jgi:hypothetical protein